MQSVVSKQQNKYLNLSLIFFSLSILLLMIFLVITDSLSINNDLLSFITFFTLLSTILLYASKKELCNKWILWGIGITFILRSIYSYLIYQSIVSPFPDSFGYLYGLKQMYQADDVSINTVSNIAQSLQFAYLYLMYWTFKVFHSTYSLYLANIFLFSVSLLLFYRSIINDFGEKVAIGTVFVSLLSMNLFLFTSNILKDSLVLFLSTLALFLYKRKKNFILLTIVIAALFTARIYTGMAFVLAFFIDTLVNEWKVMKVYKKIGAVFSIPIIILIVISGRFTSNYVNVLQSFVSGTQIVDVFVKSPIAVFKMFFSPLPWNVSEVNYPYTITLFDSCFTVLFGFSLIMFFIKWCKYKQLRRKMHLYILPIWIHAYALGVTYDGDSTRQRIAVFFFIILIYFIGMFYKPVKQKVLNTKSS